MTAKGSDSGLEPARSPLDDQYSSGSSSRDRNLRSSPPDPGGGGWWVVVSGVCVCHSGVVRCLALVLCASCAVGPGSTGRCAPRGAASVQPAAA